MNKRMKRMLCAALALIMMLMTALTATAADVSAEPAQDSPAEAVQDSSVPAQDAADPEQAPTEPDPTEPVEMNPRITQIAPVNKGVKISFTAFEGAAKYRVFIKKADGSGWKAIGDTAELYFVRTGVTPHTANVYTVRAVGSDGKFCSDYDKEGYRYYYYPVPVLKSAESVNGGVKVTWGSAGKDLCYRLYVKSSSGWKGITDIRGTTYTDTNVTSGSKYTYTVRAIDPETGAALSYFETAGISVQYIAAPQITSCAAVIDGTKVTWSAVKGAANYRLFYKNGTGWKTIGTTTATSMTHANPGNGKKYIYTVRVLDRNGKYISGFDRTGVAFTRLAAPVLKSVTSANGGLQISWNAVEGASRYRVYVKKGSDWKGVGNSDTTSFIDTTVTPLSSYTYTVRAIDPKTGAAVSYYDRYGISGQYIETPQITSISPVEGGTKFTWSAVKGAAKYRLFYHNGTGWKTIDNTTGTSMTVTALTEEKEYTVTVRAMDSSSKYISGYNTKGWTYRYIAPPAIGSIVIQDKGVVLSWDAVTGAYGYRLYRKSFGESWTRLVDTAKTSFTDTAAPVDTLYTYTLRTMNAKGALNSFHIKDTTYYYNGEIADGKIRYGGTTLSFNKGHICQGFITVDGKTYYYDETGVLKKDGLVGSQSEGYRYADKDGVIDTTARLAVSYGGFDWNVQDGIAYKVTTAKDRTLHRALKKVSEVTVPTMTKEQKLRACFNYLVNETYEYNPRVPHYRGMDWPVVYADDIFTTGGGNCFSYAAAFAFMAKAIGYDDVYACQSGGHGWTEIGGLVYDSEWQRVNQTYSYYGLSYNSSTDVDYAKVRESFPDNAWMHIAI